MKAYIQLEDGSIFQGKNFGASLPVTVGEFVFHTGMTGHQELLTDPGTYGKVVTFTYPHLGNYGFNIEDEESSKPMATAVVCRKKADHPNNFRCEMSVESYLSYYGIPGVEGVDTRALTKLLRKKGRLRGVISPEPLIRRELDEYLRSYVKKRAIYETTCSAPIVHGSSPSVGLWDFGAKKSLSGSLAQETSFLQFPATWAEEEILDHSFSALFLSSGPGNPLDYPEITEKVKNLLGRIPMFGIGLGAQFLLLALGGTLELLPVGHRGCAYPVREVSTGKILMTTQNYDLNIKALPPSGTVDFININDKKIAGFSHREKKTRGVLFLPEGSPGSKDSWYTVTEFLKEVHSHGEK